jgi:GAF domain-containing protein
MIGDVTQKELNEILLDIVDSAIAIAEADFGNVQLYDPTTENLKIVAQRGLPEFWLNYWDHVTEKKGTCGAALRTCQRIIVEDVLQSPIFEDNNSRCIMIRANIRSVQSTPLVNRSGIILGMFSTHRTAPAYPSTRVLRMLDRLSRLATDAIEMTRLKSSHRQLEERYDLLFRDFRARS